MNEKKKSVRLDDTSDGEKLVGRDTIYVDTEDDITAIIEKVKQSDSSVIALVPPGRVGALQSVVNLKLLQKAAKQGRKKIALITANAALVTLAAGLRIPVARNLTTQPELPEAPDLDDSDSDIINGEDIAIGDLARSAEPAGRHSSKEDKSVSAAVQAIETDDRIKNDVDADGEPDDKPKTPPKSQKLPDFNTFRKRLFIFGGLGLALILFLIWAIVFAPQGTITIQAKTTAEDLSLPIALRLNAATDVGQGVLQPVIKQIKKTESADFTATGSKDIGNKATGTITIAVRESAIPSAGLSFPAGTQVKDNTSGTQFVTNSTVSLPGGIRTGTISMNDYRKYCQASICYLSVDVTAANIGTNYNLTAGTNLTVSGGYSATAKADFTGGSLQTVRVVQQSDLDAVTEKLKSQEDQAKIAADLKSQMDANTVIISDSFSVSYGNVSSTPALNEAAGNSNAKATLEITYTLIGVNRADLKNLLEAQFKDLGDQKVYDNGLATVQFKNLTAGSDGYSVTINATAQIGPNLGKREAQIKADAVGKRSGEIVSDIEAIPGVKNVEVKFSPFWVSTAPAVDKLKVEFAVNE